MTKEQKRKEILKAKAFVAFSSYRTGGHWTVNTWLKATEEARTPGSELNTYIRKRKW